MILQRYAVRGARGAVVLAGVWLAGCRGDAPKQPDIRPPSGTATAALPQADSALEDADSLHATVSLFEFAEAGGTSVIPVLGAPDVTVADINQGAVLLGSVGPLAFVRTWVWAFSCGAHGNTVAAFASIDLARGTSAVLIPDDERLAIEAAYRADAAAAFARDTAESGGPFSPDSSVLTLVVPRFGAMRLALELQFSAEACYACSDGRWSGYTRSVRLPARELPAALRPYAETPAEVRAYFRVEQPDSAAGWSVIAMPGPRRDALARLFGVTAPAGGPEYLVWRHTAEALETVWLRGRGAEATVVGRRPGVWIAAGERAWTWRERRQPVTTAPCNPQ